MRLAFSITSRKLPAIKNLVKWDRTKYKTMKNNYAKFMK